MFHQNPEWLHKMINLRGQAFFYYDIKVSSWFCRNICHLWWSGALRSFCYNIYYYYFHVLLYRSVHHGFDLAPNSRSRPLTIMSQTLSEYFNNSQLMTSSLFIPKVHRVLQDSIVSSLELQPIATFAFWSVPRIYITRGSFQVITDMISINKSSLTCVLLSIFFCSSSNNHINTSSLTVITTLSNTNNHLFIHYFWIIFYPLHRLLSNY